jgi:hypothetical protein
MSQRGPTTKSGHSGNLRLSQKWRFMYKLAFCVHCSNSFFNLCIGCR